MVREPVLISAVTAIPGAKLVILPEASHFAMLQQPEAFNRAVLVFLKTN